MPDKKKGLHIEENSIIFSVSDPTGVDVKLYKEQLKHIKQNHPEIKPVGKIRSGIQNPDFILLNKERNARIYSTLSKTDLCFNVFTGIISDTECLIRTSYISTLPKGDCIWRRQKK